VDHRDRHLARVLGPMIEKLLQLRVGQVPATLLGVYYLTGVAGYDGRH
jgi:hypothetical protein